MRVDTRVADLLGDSNICENRFKINGVFRALRGGKKGQDPFKELLLSPWTSP